MLALDRVAVERIGEREIRDRAVDRGARFGIVGAHGVSDHDQVGILAEHVLGVEALVDRNLPALERRAHGRVELTVGAGDADAARLQQSRQRSHSASADGDEVDASQRHGQAFMPSRMRSWIWARSSKRLRLATRWTRFVSITTIASASRSIQSDVPVNPR